MTKIEEMPLAVMDRNYYHVHGWLNWWHGKADHCSADPEHTGRKYQWANIDGIYEKDVKHFTQLCVPCHRKKDIRPSTRLKISRYHKGRPKYFNRSPVSQYLLDGTLVSRYEALRFASEESGVSRTAICNNLSGRSKSAGGYRWRYT